MATNASIPLAYQPAKIDDPGVVEQRKQTINGMLQERDMRDQALQEGIIKLQQAREEQDDSEKFKQLYIDNEGDPDKTISAAQKAGIGPSTILAHQIAFDNQKKAALGLTTEQRKMSDDNADRMVNLLEPIKKAKDEEKQAAWTAAVAQGKTQGLINPGTTLPDQYPGDDTLDAFLAHTLGTKAVNGYAEAETKRRIDEGKASKEEIDLQNAQMEQAGNLARGAQAIGTPPPPAAGAAPTPPPVAAPAPQTGQGPLAPVQRVSPAASTGTPQQAMSTVPVGAPQPTVAQATTVPNPNPAPVPAPAPAAPVSTPVAQNNPPAGMIAPGNIDLTNRPVVNNPDGTTSTVRTITIEDDGKTILIPTVVNGKIVSNQEAIDHYKKTGENMGTFSSEDAAEEYDKDLHNRMGWNGAPGSSQEAWQNSAGSNSSAGPDDARQLMYEQTLDALPKKMGDLIKSRYGTTYNPTVLQGLRMAGMTPAQASTEAYRDSLNQARQDRINQAKVPKTIAEMRLAAADDNSPYQAMAQAAVKANDEAKGKSSKDGQISQAQITSLTRQHDDYQKKEQDQWTLHGQYGALIDSSKNPIGSQVYDPQTKKTVTLDQPMLDHFKTLYDASGKLAQQYQDESRQIRSRLGGPTGNAPQAAPAATSKPGPLPTPVKLDGGKLQITLPGGKPMIFPDQKSLNAFTEKTGLTFSQ